MYLSPKLPCKTHRNIALSLELHQTQRCALNRQYLRNKKDSGRKPREVAAGFKIERVSTHIKGVERLRTKVQGFSKY